MEHNVDTVIIGAGPAGVSCALCLQRNNVSNILVEKKEFPRDKTCGGGITQKAYRLFSEHFCSSQAERDELEKFFLNTVNVVELHYKNERLTRSKVSRPLRMVKRNDFDAFLAKIYREHGGILLQNTVAEDIDLINHKIALSNGDTARFKHLVVTDGALSSTGKKLGYNKPDLAFCVETHVPKESIDYDGAVRIYFGIAEVGYAWVFPSGDEVCVGIGGIDRDRKEYDRLLKELLSSLGANAEGCVFKGAFLPNGKIPKQSKKFKDVIFAGDAGGFNDPIYGEGLYFSPQSGVDAASAIFSGGENVSREFWAISKPLRKIINNGNTVKKFFFRKRVFELFRRRVKGKDRFVAYYCDNQVSRYGYSYLKLLKLHRDYKKDGK